MMNEHIVNEPPDIEDNPEQDNINVEEEHIPPQEAVPLRWFTRERKNTISNDYIVFLQENKFNIGMMEDNSLTLRQAL
jgi:hypothetical protein